MHDDPQAERLRALEQRIARLEQLLHVRPPQPDAPPPPPPVAPPPLPEPAAPSTAPSTAAAVAASLVREPVPPPGVQGSAPAAKRDLERFFGLAVLGRVGAAALLLAAAYFGQLGWTRLGPAARVGVIYAGGGLLIGLGFVLRARVLPRYTAVLWGAGIALCYLAGTLGCLLYELVPPPVAMASLLASAALGQWLGRLLRLEAFATIALAGAYAAPVLVGTPSPAPTGFFALLALLHSWAAWMQWRWTWHRARVLAVVATAGLAAGWYAQNGIASVGSLLLHAEALLLVVAVPELVLAFVRRRCEAGRWIAFVAVASAVQLFLFHRTIWRGEHEWFGLVAGAVWLAAGARLAATAPALANGPARLGGVLVACGALAVWHHTGEIRPWGRVVSGLAASVVLLQLRRWVRVGEFAAVCALVLVLAFVLGDGDAGRARAMTVPLLAVGGLLLAQARSPAPVFALGLGVAGALFGLCRRFTFVGDEAGWLVVAVAAASAFAVLAVVLAGVRRDRLLLHPAVGALALLGGVWAVFAFDSMRRTGVAEPLALLWNLRFLAATAFVVAAVVGRRAVPRDVEYARALLAIVALAVAFVGGLLEVQTWAGELEGGWSRVATSLYTLLFAAALLAVGFLRRLPALRWTGLAGFGIAALKVTLFDLANVDTPLRVLATGAVGAVLLVAAWAYARTRGGRGDA